MVVVCSVVSEAPVHFAKRYRVLVLAILGTVALSASSASGAQDCRTVHGRMSQTNGTPSVRIWVIGTKRVLGVSQQDDTFDQLPANIHRLWKRADDKRGHSVFGDFRVCAESPNRPGRMQDVRVISGTNLRLGD